MAAGPNDSSRRLRRQCDEPRGVFPPPAVENPGDGRWTSGGRPARAWGRRCGRRRARATATGPRPGPVRRAGRPARRLSPASSPAGRRRPQVVPRSSPTSSPGLSPSTPGRRPDRRLRIRRCPKKGNRVGWTNEQIAAATEGQTVATLFRDAVTGHGDQVALRWQDGDDWQEMTYAQYGEAATRLATALCGARHRPRRPGRADDAQPARVPRRRRRRACSSAARRSRSTTRRRPDQIAYLIGHSGVVRGDRRGRGVPRPRSSRCATELPELRELVGRRAAGRPACPTACTRGPTCCASEPGDLDDARRDRAAVGPRDRDLHVGHDRSAQGRDARPRQPHVDDRSARASRSATSRSRARASCRTSRWRTSRSAWSRTTAGSRIHYEVTTCPGAGPGREVPPGGAAADLLRGAARVGEDPRRGHGDGERRSGAQGAARRRARRRAEGVGPHARAARSSRADLAAAWAEADAGLGAVRALLGLDACIAAISGAAPIAVEIFDFFRGLGVPLSEVYGMSESTGLMTLGPVRDPGRHRRPGGARASSCELAEDGEVICRGG